jgi:hypothetical protein
VLETKLVIKLLPPNDTVAPFTKPLPDIVKVKAPTFMGDGEMLLISGIGFHSVTALELFTEAFAVSAASIVTVFGEGNVAGAL